MMGKGYRGLAIWTTNVTPQDLVLFHADSVGKTHHKQLYLWLLHNESHGVWDQWMYLHTVTKVEGHRVGISQS